MLQILRSKNDTEAIQVGIIIYCDHNKPKESL